MRSSEGTGRLRLRCYYTHERNSVPLCRGATSVLGLPAFLDHFDANRKLGYLMRQAIKVLVDCFHRPE
jgi:hypothetical protein